MLVSMYVRTALTFPAGVLASKLKQLATRASKLMICCVNIASLGG